MVVTYRDPRLDAFEAVRPKSKRKVIIVFRKSKAETEVDALTKELKLMRTKGIDLRDLHNLEA